MKAKMIIAIGLLISFQVAAQQCNQRRGKTIKAKKARIYQGVKCESLTYHETKILRLHQIRIQQLKQMAKIDGVITPRERAFIQREKQRLNRNIHIQRYNNQVRRF